MYFNNQGSIKTFSDQHPGAFMKTVKAFPLGSEWRKPLNTDRTDTFRSQPSVWSLFPGTWPPPSDLLFLQSLSSSHEILHTTNLWLHLHLEACKAVRLAALRCWLAGGSFSCQTFRSVTARKITGATNFDQKLVSLRFSSKLCQEACRMRQNRLIQTEGGNEPPSC